VVHQLEEVPAARWFRVFGRGGVQERALAEVAALRSTDLDQRDTTAATARYRKELTLRKRRISQVDRGSVADSQPGYEAWERELIERWRAAGLAAGRAEGQAKGMTEGLSEGKVRGEAGAVVAVLEARGAAVSAATRRRVLACADPAKLDDWPRRAVSVTSARARFA
jgi:hypothetical protein